MAAACWTQPARGNVFAAPPADFVYQTTKLVASKKGVLHLLNNYTGDTMSFDMGREMAEAGGVVVKTVVINDNEDRFSE